MTLSQPSLSAHAPNDLSLAVLVLLRCAEHMHARARVRVCFIIISSPRPPLPRGVIPSTPNPDLPRAVLPVLGATRWAAGHALAEDRQADRAHVADVDRLLCAIGARERERQRERE